MTRLIDPPDMLSGSLQEWQQFLTEMQRLEPKDDDVRLAIEQAEKIIADKSQLPT